MHQFIFIALCISFTCCQPASERHKEKKAKAEKELSKQAALTETRPPVAGTDGPLVTDGAFFRKKIKATLKRATKEGYATRYALLADLGLHSGSKRIFLVQLATKTVVESGLVTHGSGTTYQPLGHRIYSNTNGSLCSSLGMYKIGKAYQGQFGLAFKLYGLDADNNNAYDRAIVLHSHSCVPDTETVSPICQSWGCPTVAPAFLKTLATYIHQSEKPLLLYIFDRARD